MQRHFRRGLLVSPAFDLAAFARAADAAITTSASLEAIAAALASEPGVVSVRVADYLLKSYPPRRDLVVEVRGGPGPNVRVIVQLDELDERRYTLHALRAAR
jgi:hypothetical protein